MPKRYSTPVWVTRVARRRGWSCDLRPSATPGYAFEALQLPPLAAVGPSCHLPDIEPPDTAPV